MPLFRSSRPFLSPEDRRFLERALELAYEAKAAGNAPIGAVLVLDGRVIAEGRNAVRIPAPDLRRHAEIEAFSEVSSDLWSRASEMTCYASLEPCTRCTAAIIALGIGRVVYGAPDIVPRGRRPDSLAWIGPAGDRRARVLRRKARRAVLRHVFRTTAKRFFGGR